MRLIGMRSLVAAVILRSTFAFAGSDTRDCETADRSIVMSAGNGSNRVQIKYVESKKPDLLDAPVKIMPHYDYNTPPGDDVILAIPISAEKVIAKDHKQLHVTHKDGNSCDGRESWDDRSVQTYLFTAHDGRAPLVFNGKTIKGLTGDGYVIAELRCHTYGVSSPGGCHVGPDDESEWR